MNSLFDNPQAKKNIERLYQCKLDELPISYEFLKIETSFGDTNIIMTGPEDKPPLVLLHGFNGCAPIVIEALIELVNDFRIYAIDIIGQPNLSTETRPSMEDNSYGQWMYEILSRLNIRDVYLVGISFGGFISWKTLVFEEKRISKAFLIVPAGIVNSSPLTVLWHIFLPMRLYKWRKKMKYVHQFLRALFTERNEFSAAFLSKVFLHFESDSTSTPIITEQEAQIITTPIHIIAAEKDLLFPGKKVIKRAQQIFLSLESSLLLENTRHIPGLQANKEIVEVIRRNL
ncbi:MAG: alpha/beta hydrolase [Chitinophagales bacterium]|nr:alpha/beta hydrolase [Chitinophagales bacterium]